MNSDERKKYAYSNDLLLVRQEVVKKIPLLGGLALVELFIQFAELRQLPEADQHVLDAVAGYQNPAHIVGLEVFFLLRLYGDDRELFPSLTM